MYCNTIFGSSIIYLKYSFLSSVVHTVITNQYETVVLCFICNWFNISIKNTLLFIFFLLKDIFCFVYLILMRFWFIQRIQFPSYWSNWEFMSSYILINYFLICFLLVGHYILWILLMEIFIIINLLFNYNKNHAYLNQIIFFNLDENSFISGNNTSDSYITHTHIFLI